MGVGSVRIAKVIISLVWLFIILMVVIGNALHSDKHALYQSPTPVRTSEPRCDVLGAKMSSAVLVLDWSRLSAISYLGRVCLVLDNTCIFFLGLHTSLSLEPRQHYF